MPLIEIDVPESSMLVEILYSSRASFSLTSRYLAERLALSTALEIFRWEMEAEVSVTHESGERSLLLVAEGLVVCLFLFLLLRLCNFFLSEDTLDFVMVMNYGKVFHVVEYQGCSQDCSVNKPIVFDH